MIRLHKKRPTHRSSVGGEIEGWEPGDSGWGEIGWERAWAHASGQTNSPHPQIRQGQIPERFHVEHGRVKGGWRSFLREVEWEVEVALPHLQK
jgi:hypothetical protein